MGTRECPACGASIKIENLERHAAKVHPGQSLSFRLTEGERQGLRPGRTHGSRSGLRRSAVAVALVAILVVALAWALPRLPLGGSSSDTPMHIHPNLHITIAGQSVSVPTNIGIAPELWIDHTLDEHGMMGSMSPLHTHDASGMIHVESQVTRAYTIGEFFRVWGESFDGGQVLGHPATSGHEVWMVVDGSEVQPSTAIVLRDLMQIEILCGTR